MVEMPEEELYSRKAALLKRALAEADRLDKAGTDIQASKNKVPKRDGSPAGGEMPG